MKKLILLVLISSAIVLAKPTMSQKNYEKLKNAQEFIEQNNFDKAKEILNALLEKSNNYTKSYAYQYLANIAIRQEDYKTTKVYYENIIKLNSFEKKDIDRIKLSLSKIYLSLEEYKKTIEISKYLLKNSKQSKTSILENLVYSYYYLKDFKNSIFYCLQYVQLDKKENIYQILYSSYIEQKNYTKAIDVLESMIKYWPKKQNYWLQLSSLYQEVKNYKKALSTIELAYKKNILDHKKHTIFFANLLLQNELYNKASLVLEDGLKNSLIQNDKKTFELLVACYINAKETTKAINFLESSKFAKDHKYIKLLANLYYEKHDYKNTIKVLSSYEKTKQTSGDSYILLALSYYEIEDLKNCKTNLQKALKSAKVKKKAIKIAKALRVDLNIN